MSGRRRDTRKMRAVKRETRTYLYERQRRRWRRKCLRKEHSRALRTTRVSSIFESGGRGVFSLFFLIISGVCARTRGKMGASPSLTGSSSNHTFILPIVVTMEEKKPGVQERNFTFHKIILFWKHPGRQYCIINSLRRKRRRRSKIRWRRETERKRE